VTEAETLNRVGVLGASSFVGKALSPLLTDNGYQLIAFSRQARQPDDDSINWLRLPAAKLAPPTEVSYQIGNWICVAPVWVLPDYFPWLKSMGAKRVVALSSTSRFTKAGSSDITEQALARRLVEAEQKIAEWAQANGIAWIILRPTLIYGLGLDKNVCEIARFVRRYTFFPLLGKAAGLRQPVHVQDVAQACVAALRAPVSNRAYNISGGETLTYRDMVARVFSALGRPQHLLSVPLSAFRVAVSLLRILPRYRHWSGAMAERMNRDMVFDHTEAAKDLGFNPRAFVLSAIDLPP
jgi:nucleoside-diphosphate-sugar epimerase